MLKTILAITGKPGLYKLVTRGNNMLIVESLVDGKRLPTYARDRIVALSDISMFTTGDDVVLSDVLTSLGKVADLKVTAFDPKKADNAQLAAEFKKVLPDYDEDRVYPSDIRKLFVWYNILINAGITDFEIKEEGEAAEEVKPEVKETKVAAPKNTAAKASTKSAAASAKTGVGTKRG